MSMECLIDAGDAQLRVAVDGDERAPALVLSNSLGTTLDMWAPQVPALAREFRVIRYDTRGHGGSSVTPGPYVIGQLGRDVIALLDALHIERASLAGVSMGGMTGMWLGIHAPQRLDRLAIVCSSAHIGGEDGWNARIRAVQADGMGAVADAVVSRWFTPEFAQQEPAVIDRMKAMFRSLSADGYAAACAAVRDMNQLDEIASITAPTLVITGSGDLATPPAMSSAMVERIPGAQQVVVPGAHLSNIECAPAVTDALLTFLRGKTLAGA
ncbi:3-oxoadipate enol-lactonase [Pandoraea apista]|uniref:3-oxoadipate enol-lactonase n=1 Tax=Pandoraea apista TaxID=93218 RepID=A0A0B5FMU9_9BURK|nr:3-oxoadipate enol-lactonase [Pandoraea apista]AJF01024.2 3-oxoadipate enol-lactonase [Pandoraea apista]AKH73119.1 3-oxoadipate enol-lactonase [Pandoraea apista]AKI61514.1 3-oxoadipate enol-lactonase [Pandoraea apista]ALS65427.1 3-oxoadipate enol-lactonase [Pandoraea apista]AVF39721.1 3-oxoadipate enol-lactonase [Pandoraea apista]